MGILCNAEGYGIASNAWAIPASNKVAFVTVRDFIATPGQRQFIAGNQQSLSAGERDQTFLLQAVEGSLILFSIVNEDEEILHYYSTTALTSGNRYSIGVECDYSAGGPDSVTIWINGVSETATLDPSDSGLSRVLNAERPVWCSCSNGDAEVDRVWLGTVYWEAMWSEFRTLAQWQAMGGVTVASFYESAVRHDKDCIHYWPFFTKQSTIRDQRGSDHLTWVGGSTASNPANVEMFNMVSPALAGTPLQSTANNPGGTPYTTASDQSVTAGVPIRLVVLVSRGGGSAAETPTITNSGTAINWGTPTENEAANFGVAGDDTRVLVYDAVPTATETISVSATLANTHSGCILAVYNLVGSDASGTIVQSEKAEGDGTGDTLSLSLASFASANNAAFFIAATSGGDTVTATPTDFTESPSGGLTYLTPTRRMYVWFKASAGQSVSATLTSGVGAWIVFGAEIKAAPAGGGEAGPFRDGRTTRRQRRGR